MSRKETRQLVPDWLVVEDNLDTLHLMRLHLMMWVKVEGKNEDEVPYVIGVADARRAAFAVEENNLTKKPCRFILDANLPDKNGFVIRQWLDLAGVPKQRVLIISTDYEEYHRGLIENAGYSLEEAKNLVMRKPIELNQFLDRVAATGVVVRASPRLLKKEELMM